MGNDGIMGYFITWAQPYYFWVLGISLVGVLCGGIYLVRARRALNMLAAPPYRTALLRGYSPLYFFVRLFLVMVTFILLWIALLRPQYPLDGPVINYEYGRDVVI